MLKNGPRGWMRAVPRVYEGEGGDGWQGGLLQHKLNDIYRVRDILSRGHGGHRMALHLRCEARRQGEDGGIEYENSHRKFRTPDRPRSRRSENSEEQPFRPDVQQKTEVSSIAGRSPSGSGRAIVMLGRSSPMRWDDISPHKGYMK